MANRLNTNPIVIDTAATAVSGPLSIIAIKWVATPSAAIAQNDTLIIKEKDSNGDTLIQCVAQESTPNQEAYSLNLAKPWMVSGGLYIDTLGGGEVQIFLG